MFLLTLSVKKKCLSFANSLICHSFAHFINHTNSFQFTVPPSFVKSNLDLIHFWMMSIYVHAVPPNRIPPGKREKEHIDDPKIIIVATFKCSKEVLIISKLKAIIIHRFAIVCVLIIYVCVWMCVCVCVCVCVCRRTFGLYQDLELLWWFSACQKCFIIKIRFWNYCQIINSCSWLIIKFPTSVRAWPHDPLEILAMTLDSS